MFFFPYAHINRQDYSDISTYNVNAGSSLNLTNQAVLGNNMCIGVEGLTPGCSVKVTGHTTLQVYGNVSVNGIGTLYIPILYQNEQFYDILITNPTTSAIAGDVFACNWNAVVEIASIARGEPLPTVDRSPTAGQTRTITGPAGPTALLAAPGAGLRYELHLTWGSAVLPTADTALIISGATFGVFYHCACKASGANQNNIDHKGLLLALNEVVNYQVTGAATWIFGIDYRIVAA